MSDWPPKGIDWFYSDDSCAIACGDCREILPLLSGDNIDAVVTDPPFFVRSDAWDAFEDVQAFSYFTGRWMAQCYKVAPLLAVFFPDKFVPLLLEVAERRAIPYRRALVWRKPPGSQYAGASLDGFWFDFELIQVFGEPRVRQARATRFGVLEERTIIGQKHGCEKPQNLYRILIDAYVREGAVVLDPFMGTGTALRAAKNMGRRAIGIDKDRENCEEAVRSIRQEVLPLVASPSPTESLFAGEV